MKVKELLNKMSMASTTKTVRIICGFSTVAEIRRYELEDCEYKGTDNRTVNSFRIDDNELDIFVK